jgi:hypothetical protein
MHHIVLYFNIKLTFYVFSLKKYIEKHLTEVSYKNIYLNLTINRLILKHNVTCICEKYYFLYIE